MFNELKRVIKVIILSWRYKAMNVKLNIRCNPSIECKFGGSNRIGANTAFKGMIGYGSYIGNNCSINGHIGKYCSISHNVVTLIGSHPVHTFVSTSPCFYSLKRQNGLKYIDSEKYEENKYADKEKKYGVKIGNDVWIGYGATILGGVSIGDGAIIGARALINKDIPPYAIVAGVPARIVGYRFSNDIISFLQGLRWWDKPEIWIRQNADSFEDIDRLIKRIGENR